VFADSRGFGWERALKIWLIVGLWFAVNLAFVAIRLYVTAEGAPEDVAQKYPPFVSNSG
jgi:hypothetical protein